MEVSTMRVLGRSVLVLMAGLLLAATPASPPGDTLRGFTLESSTAERDWETKFRAVPSTDSLRSYMRRLSARPHHVGSPYDRDNAEWILAKFKSFGLDARIETFDVLFPTYNAYSIDGDVTAPLVYVNYGVPADYDRLERLGISVKGAIVIARYFGSWRGIKPKVAAEHGAIGCLIYSDPRDDGYVQGDTYPRGPWRPRFGVQRGSVMEMAVYPGDPLTPGVGATKDAKRLPLAEAHTLTKIPVLPISYADAQPLLAAIGGPVAPDEWRGGLGITYHVGPGPARVHLRVKS